ncbi:beta-sandwich lipoprotein [Comamonas sp. MYb69]|uniref:beta-sandwich lipoprotein n=1 Tax=Comamonas sp. MYb69 TaxID=1848650 RepID=UPI0030B23139
MKTKTIAAITLVAALAGCTSDADVASRNLSQAADNFEVNRRVVFYNGITGEYMLSIEGLCSKGNGDSRSMVTITCKTAPGVFKKHYLGLSDNITYFMEQLEPLPVGASHYVVNFKPTAILPDIRLRQ